MYYSETWWPFRLIRRWQNAIEILLIPLRILALLLEIIIGLGFLASLAIAYGVYTHKIPEALVIGVLNDIGGQALPILKAQGIF
jgi:hypothetical protein